MMLPDTILSGYPEREYRLTGEWSEQQARGGRNVAYRNRRMVWYPIYRAEDGSIICPTWLAQGVCVEVMSSLRRDNVEFRKPAQTKGK